VHNIGKHDEQIILKLQLVVFHLKHNVSTKQLMKTDFFVKKKSGFDTVILK
jgi:hypothetical protein